MPHSSFANLNNWHFDNQFQRMKWPEPPKWRKSFTFTVPLSLPRSGAGLEFLQTHMLDFVGRGLAQGQENYFRRPPVGEKQTQVIYEAGELIIHSGQHLHRFAPIAFQMDEKEADRPRITLQGHGLWMQGSWVLYW